MYVKRKRVKIRKISAKQIGWRVNIELPKTSTVHIPIEIFFSAKIKKNAMRTRENIEVEENEKKDART